MRRFPTTPLIVVLAIVAVVGGWLIFAKTEVQRYQAVNMVRTAKSYIKLRMDVRYPSGPIATESYVLVNDNGASKATYAVTNRAGTIATFDEQLRGVDVSETFDYLVHDGIWEIDSKRRRTTSDVVYTVRIDQTAQGQSGHREITFANPKYLATAREFHIKLDPKKPTPSENDLLHMDATSIADPRYEKIVSDFRSFGSPTFKRTIASARTKLLKS